MRRLKVPLFRGELWACSSRDEFERAYRRLSVRQEVDVVDVQRLPVSGETAEFFDRAGRMVILAWVGRDGGSIAHEATHIAQAVAEQVKLNPLTERESFAYIVQWAYNELRYAAARR